MKAALISYKLGLAGVESALKQLPDDLGEGWARGRRATVASDGRGNQQKAGYSFERPTSNRLRSARRRDLSRRVIRAREMHGPFL